MKKPNYVPGIGCDVCEVSAKNCPDEWGVTDHRCPCNKNKTGYWSVKLDKLSKTEYINKLKKELYLKTEEIIEEIRLVEKLGDIYET